MIRELILKNRSYRRFYQERTVSLETLQELVDIARLTPSAANRQPLAYVLANTQEKNTLIFNSLAWAGYLKEWPGPDEGERPAGYIVILQDTRISKNPAYDAGIAVQSMLLAAVEKGLGGCIFANIKKEELKKNLGLADPYEILLVVALGKPKEEVVIEEVSPGGSIKYWRDEAGTHHVPKRLLKDIIID